MTKNEDRLSRRVWLPILLGTLVVTGGAWGLDGEDEEDADKPVWKESVVVTAGRLEQPHEDVAANVTVLERASVEHSAAVTVDDYLRQVPGFSLFRRSSSVVSHPTSQGVSLRGIGPSGVSRTLVLLDGVRLNDPFGGWVYWSRVPLDLVDKAEVVRGGASNVWGNSALGGVIQLFTERPENSRVGLLGEYGSKDTIRAQGSVDHRWSRGSVRLFGSYFDTDGYDVLREDQRGSIDVPAYSNHENFGLGVDFDVSDSGILTLSASTFEEDRGNGTPLTGNGTETDAYSLRYSNVSDGGSEWRATIAGQDQTFFSTFSSQAADRNSESPALDQFLVPSDSFGVSLQWLRPFEAGDDLHTLTVGGETRSGEGQTNEDFFFNGAGFNWRRQAGGDEQVSGFYVQDTWAAGDRVLLQLGARVDRWDTENGFRTETSLINGFVRRDDEYEDRSETEVSPRLSAVYSLSDRTRLRGSAYESFRAPTINELFRPFRVRSDITEANAELVPETLTGYELGIESTGSTVRGGLTLFHNTIDNPIANVTLGFGPGFMLPCGFTPGGGSCRQRQNLDRSRIQGLEAEIQARPHRDWLITGSYLLSDTEITSAPQQPVLEGNQIAQVPENQLVAGVTYSGSRFVEVAFQGRMIDEQWDDDLNTRLLEDFVVFDLSLMRRFGDRWSAFVSVENVFDEEVETAATGNGLVTIGGPQLVRGGVRLRLGY